jgi:hypothetical protein
LTRRANHRHISIIARTAESPRRETGRGFFAFGFPESDGGRISRAHHLLRSSASSQDAPPSVLPSDPLKAGMIFSEKQLHTFPDHAAKLAGARERCR